MKVGRFEGQGYSYVDAIGWPYLCIQKYHSDFGDFYGFKILFFAFYFRRNGNFKMLFSWIKQGCPDCKLIWMEEFDKKLKAKNKVF